MQGLGRRRDGAVDGQVVQDPEPANIKHHHFLRFT
jgi:hypothetical protein